MKPRISCPPCVALWGAAAAMLALAAAPQSCSEAPPEGRYISETDQAASESAQSDAAADASAPESGASPGPIADSDALRRAANLTPPTLEGAGLRIPIPPEWSLDESAASPMRLATYVAAGGEEQAPATIVFYHFGPGQGGSVEQNMLRWSRLVLDEAGEPTEPAIDAFEVGPLRIAVATLEGTYMQGPPGGELTPRENWALVGAVVEGGPEGSVFARLTGPRDAALAQRPVLLSALRSIAAADQP